MSEVFGGLLQGLGAGLQQVQNQEREDKLLEAQRKFQLQLEAIRGAQRTSELNTRAELRKQEIEQGRSAKLEDLKAQTQIQNDALLQRKEQGTLFAPSRPRTTAKEKTQRMTAADRRARAKQYFDGKNFSGVLVDMTDGLDMSDVELQALANEAALRDKRNFDESNGNPESDDAGMKYIESVLGIQAQPAQQPQTQQQQPTETPLQPLGQQGPPQGQGELGTQQNPIPAELAAQRKPPKGAWFIHPKTGQPTQVMF